jgi:hypothetical protein
MSRDRLSIDQEFEHQWQKGYWISRGRYSTREDICQHCGCERHLIKGRTKDGEPFKEIVSYHRAGTSRGRDNMPECWGAMDPQ